MELETTLILILSIGFFVLLVLSIVLVATVIIILRRVQRLTAKLETFSEDWAETLRNISKKVAPVALTTIIGTVIKRFVGRRK
jgi:pilus assembly protein TadC